MVDYLIVGSGLSGATLARLLHDKGFSVLVVDRRSHLGGNVYDHSHESGIRVHTYGPHYFRTTSDEIWQFVNRFASFYKYEAALKSFVDGDYENWPIAGSYIKKYVGADWKPTPKEKIENFEDAALSLMPESIYEKFIKGYNIKQWGVDPKELSAELIKRFDVRHDDEPRLMPNHKYQGLPVDGYAKMMEKMLEGIPTVLNFDFLKNKDTFQYNKKLVFTGPIDEFYNFCFGKLKYRGQKREHSYTEGVDFVQPCGQVNNPQLENGPQIRTLEWKQMMQPEYAKAIKGTLLTTEITYTPENPEDFEYPFPDDKNKKLYQQYRALADQDDKLLICGRLGEYRYYDMDQIIGRAMKLFKEII